MSFYVSFGFPCGQEKVYRTYYFTSSFILIFLKLLKKSSNMVRNEGAYKLFLNKTQFLIEYKAYFKRYSKKIKTTKITNFFYKYF